MTSRKLGQLAGNRLKFYPVGAGICLLFLLVLFAATPLSIAAQGDVFAA